MSPSPGERSAQLTTLLTPVVESAGHELEQVTVSAAGRRSVVRVVVDRAEGVDLDDVAELSRRVGQALEEADERDPSLLGPSYVLEVSSPGVDRPLTTPRHFERNTGRLVELVTSGEEKLVGRVLSVEDDAVRLDVEGTSRVLPLADVRRARVQVEFSRGDT